jgi:biotin operon repressor
MRGPARSGPVFAYLEHRIGQAVHVDDVAADLGFTKQQVKSAVNNLRTTKGIPIETLVAGYSWRYLPNSKPSEDSPGNGSNHTKRIFEEIGVTKTGLIILQDEDGNLFSAQEL